MCYTPCNAPDWCLSFLPFAFLQEFHMSKNCMKCELHSKNGIHSDLSLDEFVTANMIT